MNSDSTEKLAHLLNLPAELRNTIYSYIFEDTRDHQLDILSWNDILPCSSILRVNRQTRSECLSLHGEAIANLANDHHWVFCIDARFSHKAHRESVLLQSKKLSPYIPISNLSVVFEFPCTHLYGPRPDISVDFGTKERRYAEWNLTTQASVISRYRSSVVEHVLQNAIKERLKSALTLGDDAQWLNVQNCLQPFFEIFDEIRFFSALEFWEY